LVIAIVSVADYAAFRKLVADLRVRRGLHKTYEFHYSHIPEVERTAFLEALREASFQAWLLVVDKRRLSENFKRRNQYDLLGKFVAVLADRLPADMAAGATMVIDAHSPASRLTRAIRVAISDTLRTSAIQPGIRRVRARPAHCEDGLQLADMLAGAVVESRIRGKMSRLTGRIMIIQFEESKVTK
jgi:hypothetical protein